MYMRNPNCSNARAKNDTNRDMAFNDSLEVDDVAFFYDEVFYATFDLES